MTNIEKLESEIRKALPELMELTEGCEVKFNRQTYDCKAKITEIDDNNEACNLLLEDNNNKFTTHSLDFVKRKSTIIGHPITILYLLRWLDGISTGYCALDCDGKLSMVQKGWKEYIGTLDLSKPLLSQQSNEVINELLKLIN